MHPQPYKPCLPTHNSPCGTIPNNLPLTHGELPSRIGAEIPLGMHWADLSSDTKCWNRAADAQRARHTPQAVGPPHTSPNTRQRVLGLLGRHSPQKASPIRGCTLNLINHACPPTTHNVGLFPTISPSHIERHRVNLSSDTNCWHRASDTRAHTRARTCPRLLGRHTRTRTHSSGS